MIQNMFQNVVVISLTTSAVIVILLLLLPLIHKRYTAKWRYWVWVVFAVRLLIPFSPSLPQAPVKIATPSQTIEYKVPQNAAVPPALNNTAAQQGTKNAIAIRTVELNEILSTIWVLGIAVFLIFHISGYLLFKKSILRFSKPVKEKQMIELWQEVKAEMKISRDIQLISCENVQSPMMAGFFKPILFLPSLDISSSDLKMILKHELIHYKRKDIWYKLLLFCANAVHWFNPIVYLMITRSNKDIEMVCDSEMIKNSDVTFRKQYGEMILSAIHKGSQRQMALSTYFYGGKKTMKERFVNIFDMGKKRKGVVSLCLLLAVACMVGGLVACHNDNIIVSGLSGQTTSSSVAVQSSSSEPISSSQSSIPVIVQTDTDRMVSESINSTMDTASIIYKNTQYGFNLSLPSKWKGYKLMTDKWEGNYYAGPKKGTNITGIQFDFYGPLWDLEKNQYIPIMVFTVDQWSTVALGGMEDHDGRGKTLQIGSGPNGPVEIGRNSKYVFALPFRYDNVIKDPTEVHTILESKSFQPTENIK